MIREALKQKGWKATSCMSTLLLKRMFQGSKKFMQFSLKPKNPNLSSNTQRGNRKYEQFKSLKSMPPRALKRDAEL